MTGRDVTVEEARLRLDDLIHEVSSQEAEVRLTDSGRVVARLVPAERPLNEVRREFGELADELRGKFADVPEAELDELIDRAVAEVRASRRQTPRA